MKMSFRGIVMTVIDSESRVWVHRAGWVDPGDLPLHPLVSLRGHPHPDREPRAAELRTAGAFTRIDGLDGLRGLAVLAVLFFHLWPALLPGGFIGVTLFFALSGYLITSILLHELEGTGTISLRGFYSRRFRRLVPVSLLTLTVVAVGWSLAGWLSSDLHRELLFSLGQGANWGQVLADQRYGVDAATSPVLHFWSLAIEEQMYLLLPLALLLCGTRRRGRIVVGIGLAASVYAVVRVAGDPSLSYYSTFTRGGEVLVGSLVALTLRGRTWDTRRGRRGTLTVAAAGLAVLTAVALRTHVTDGWYSRGGLMICAVIAVVVIAAVAGSPALGRRIDWWPLARLGQISYAVYLFHWPLLKAFERSDLSPRLVPWATAAATISLALASERWFERPVRSGAVPTPRLVAVGACALLLVPVVSTAAMQTPSRERDFEAAAHELDAVISAAAAPATAAPDGTLGVPSILRAEDERAAVEQGAAMVVPAAPLVPVRVGFFGDSKALTLALGTARHGFDQISIGTSYTALGCPTGRGGKVREAPGAPVYPTAPDCDWAAGIPRSVAQDGPLDVAVVWSGTWDIADRKVPALGNSWTNVDDPAYREWLLGEMVTLTDTIMFDTGATKVVWLTVPVDPASTHPERFAQWTWLLEQLRQQRPDAVTIVDLAAYVAGSGEAAHLLPDGVHPTHGADDPAVNSGAELAQALLIPVVTSVRPG